MFVESGISDEDRNVSVFMNDGRGEVALLGEGEKNLVKMFFKKAKPLATAYSNSLDVLSIRVLKLLHL